MRVPGIHFMADLSDYYPASQQVPQNVNGTQPVMPRSAAPAGAVGAAGGAPALWVIIIVAAGILLLHAGE